MDYEVSEMLQKAKDERKRITTLLLMAIRAYQLDDGYKKSVVQNVKLVLDGRKMPLSHQDSKFLNEVKFIMYLTEISVDDMISILCDLKDLI